MPKQLSRIDAGIDLNVSFPTKTQREYQNGTIRALPTMPIYRYWTNFDRKKPDTWTLVQDKDYEPEESYWTFTTNIEPSDFDYGWDEPTTRKFLMKMWEIYRYRRAD
jgi:hypothetical protein